MKKLVAAISVIAVLFSAGCGKKDSSGDVAKVKWYNIGAVQKDEEKVMEKVNEMLGEKYGLELDLQVVDSGAYGEKINMIISSGEEFDLCFTSNWLNQFSVVAAGGGFMDVTEKLKNNYKDLYNSLPEFVWTAGTYNNQIMAVPNYQQLYYHSAAFMPQRIVDKYDIDLSKIDSIDDPDFEEMLKRISEGGEDAYTIKPYDFAGASVKEQIPFTEISFLYVDPVTHKVSSYWDLESMEKDLLMFRDWYKKGYIRKDVISAKNSANDDKYCIWASGYAPGKPEAESRKAGEPITYVTLKDVAIPNGAGVSTMTGISATSKNPDAALKLLQAVNTDKELFNMIVYGIEGEHYNKIDDNLVATVEDTRYDKTANAWSYGNAFNAFYVEGGAPVGSYEEIDKVNREAKRSFILGMTPDLTNIKSEVSKIFAVLSEYQYIRYGAEDPLPLLEEMRAKMKAAGMDKVIEDVQRQVDEFFKNKN